MEVKCGIDGRSRLLCFLLRGPQTPESMQENPKIGVISVPSFPISTAHAGPLLSHALPKVL
jgi:hypothetical protein